MRDVIDWHKVSSASGRAPTAPAPACEVDYDRRGFRLLPGGLEAALTEALTLARSDSTRAPLLLLVQDAPPLPVVLREIFAGGVF